MSNNQIEFCAAIAWETEMCYILEDGVNKINLPKSLCLKKRQIKDSDYEFTVPEWWAFQEGVI